MPKTKPPYAQGFRDQMVELVRSGRNPSDLSKEFGCHVTSILSWVRKAGGSGATMLPADVAALNAQERQELIELRRNCAKSRWSVTYWQRLRPGLPAKARRRLPRLRTRESKPGRTAHPLPM
jgi:transposase